MRRGAPWVSLSYCEVISPVPRLGIKGGWLPLRSLLSNDEGSCKRPKAVLSPLAEANFLLAYLTRLDLLERTENHEQMTAHTAHGGAPVGSRRPFTTN